MVSITLPHPCSRGCSLGEGDLFVRMQRCSHAVTYHGGGGIEPGVTACSHTHTHTIMRD